MPTLATFLISDGIQNVPSPNGMFVPTIVGPAIALRPQYIPGSLSFGMTLGIRGIDMHTTNTLQTQLIAPNGTIVHDTGALSLPAEPIVDSELPPDYKGFMINLDLRNVPFHEQGVYAIRIYINGSLLSEEQVPVYKRIDPHVN